MEFIEALDKLVNSAEYKKWYSENPGFYLSHAFIMVDPQVKQEWQIGYYNYKHDTVVTFAIGDKIMLNPESEVFKENDRKISPLSLEYVSVTLKQALDAAEKVQKEKYSAHTPSKKIVILQKLDAGHQVWNITYVTSTFKTLNIKIDSKNCEILSDELFDLFRIEK